MSDRAVAESGAAAPTYLWTGANGTHLKLSPSAYHLLRAVEGGSSYAEIAACLSQRQDQPVVAAEVEAAHRQLADQIEAIERRNARPPSGFLLRLTLLPAAVVVPVAALLGPAFSLAGLALILLGTAAGLGPLLAAGLTGPFTPGDYWLGYGLFLISLLVHELGHASACLRYGARPSEIGFATYWIFPVFYSDVSAAWQLKRWQRVVVDLGGLYLQAGVAAVYAGLFALGGWPALKAAVLMIVFSAPFMLNPFLKFDGYWLVADALGVTNLSQQPVRIVRQAVARLRGQAVPPLPWSTHITAMLTLYTLLATGFWLLVLVQLAPMVWGQLIGYPALVAAIAGDLLAPPHLPSLGRFLSWLTASYVLVLGWLMLWRVIRPMTRRLRTSADRGPWSATRLPSDGAPSSTEPIG